MKAIGSRSIQQRQIWKAGAVLLCLGLAGIGCGGGDSGDVFGAPPPIPDLEGTSALDAIVIQPDGPNIKGSIDFASDEDWFKFRAGVNQTYVLQIFGYPPDPDLLLEDDLTGEGAQLLLVQIVGQDGATQILNTTGGAGGAAYDVDPELGEMEGEGFVIGDSRIAWVSPATGDFYVRITHQVPTGTGLYELSIASSTLGRLVTDRVASRQGAYDADQVIVNDMFELQYSGPIAGMIGFHFWEFPELELHYEFGVLPIILGTNTDFEAPVIHFHTGYPNVQFPVESNNFTAGADFHNSIFSIDIMEIGARAESDSKIMEGVYTAPDGTQLRVPVTIESDLADKGSPTSMVSGTAAIHFGDALAANREISDNPLFLEPDGLIRTMTGFPWYADIHATQALELIHFIYSDNAGFSATNGAPAAVSLPNGGLDGLFESEMNMSFLNTREEDGSAESELERGGIGPDFTLHYDSALKTFQIKRARYDVILPDSGGPNTLDVPPTFEGIRSDTSDQYESDLITIHDLATGAMIIDLGTIPPPQGPKAMGECPPCEPGDPMPGFRNTIKQLSDDQSILLLNSYYNGGIYALVTDSVTGQQLARADAAPLAQQLAIPPLGISDFAFPEPFRSSNEGWHRGTVNFVSDYEDGGPISVASNGRSIGAIYSFIEEGALPSCGEYGDADSLTDEQWPNRYPYKAVAADGTTWEGHYEIAGDSCETIVLSAE